MGLNRGYCREVADDSGGGASLWRYWRHFVYLTTYRTSLPLCFFNDLTTWIKKLYVPCTLEVQRLS